MDLVSPVMDHGGGTWDALAKIVADTLQVPLDKVGLSPAETLNTGYDVATHATRGIYCGGAAAYNTSLKEEKSSRICGGILIEHPRN